jgi:cytochrome c
VRLRYRLLAGACLLTGAGAINLHAQEEPPPTRTLTPGKGAELATARCVTCHDATHITRTKLSRGEWEFNIKNMIERGAPVAPDEVAPILEYLATYYNRDVAPPAAAESASTPAGGGDAVTQLMNANACTACHQVDKRVVGPSFREVAAKYAGDTAAAGVLAKKIRAGGSGVWGAVPMPPNAGMTDADITHIVNWILAQK